MARSALGAAVRLKIGAPTGVELQEVLSMFLKTQLDRELVSLNVSRRVEETLPSYDQTSTK